MAGKEIRIETYYYVEMREPGSDRLVMKRAIGCDRICDRVECVETPAVVVDMFSGLEVPREQAGGSVNILVGTDWVEYMLLPVERVYSLQLWTSVLSAKWLICGEVPLVNEWEAFQYAAECSREREGLAGPVPRNVRPQLMRPGEGPLPAPGGFMRERRLQNPPELVTIETDEEEEERLPEYIRRIPNGGCWPAKKERTAEAEEEDVGCWPMESLQAS